jgi:hypothetical protein
MTDREEREQVLETLTNMRDWMEAAQQIRSTPARINALNYAISSIKTDLKYDLLYEDNQIDDADKMIAEDNSCEPNNSEIPTGSTTKNNLAVDTIDRVELLRAMDTWDKFGFTTRYGLERLDKDDKGFVPYVKYDDMLKCVKGMSSVTPKGVTVTDFADKCRECGARIGGGIRNGFDNSNNCNSSSTFVGNN